MSRIKCDNVNLQNNSIVISNESDFQEGSEWQKKRSSILEAAKKEADNIVAQAKMQAQGMNPMAGY